ncbi:hypothetical protein NIES2100_75840 [Calothrix sp. NIES-2100]|nr:hypothetical protein NIES2100_75840 [Calothrix sp. NIES-2100]
MTFAIRGCLKSGWLYLSTNRSPLTPLKKGGKRIKVPLFKGDLGGSQTFCYPRQDFSNILLDSEFILRRAGDVKLTPMSSAKPLGKSRLWSPILHLR